MNKKKAVFALCGSFCTFEKAFEQMETLASSGFDIYPVFSFAASETDTRFGRAEDYILRSERICGKKAITSIEAAEHIGPVIKPDIMIIEPCTGNTLGKLASGIYDTPVTLSAKAHLRNEKPLLIAVSSNDALSASAQNIGKLLNTKNIFFVPMRQDAPESKPRSIVADFTKTIPAINLALENKQIQPIIM